MDSKSGRLKGIRTLLLLGMSTVLALLCVVSGLLVWQQSRMEGGYRTLLDVNTMERHLLECRRQEKNFLLRHQQANTNLFLADFDSLATATARLVGEADDLTTLATLEQLSVQERDYASSFAEVVSWSGGAEEERNALVDRTVTHARACHTLMNDLRATSITHLRAANTAARTGNLATVLVGVLLSLLVAGWLTARIVRPLEYLRQRAEQISVGDIQDIDVQFSELEMARLANRETCELARAFQRFVAGLRLAVSSEIGTMDSYHMSILVLVGLALGSAGRAMVERARARAGFGSFADIRPEVIETFLAALREESAEQVSQHRMMLLCDAIRRVPR